MCRCVYVLCAGTCVHLWQVEADASRRHSVVSLDCKHILVIGRGLHNHMSAEMENT